MFRTTDPSVSVVMPAQDEADNLEIVLGELPAVDEVVLVDGHSADGTVEVAAGVRPGITIVEQTPAGKGNALACGLASARGDVVVMLDADGSADPGEIPAFVEALVSGGDIAMGTRFHRRGRSDDITAVRGLGNRTLTRVMNTLFGTEFTDLCYGYNALWRDVVPALGLPADAGDPSPRWGDGFEIETLLNCRAAAAGLTAIEVPSVERERMFGETHLRTFRDGRRVLRTLVAEWRRASTRGAECEPTVSLPEIVGRPAVEEPR
jgi:glycosyltransferase involved in cell wall biosynthesis